jgi:glycosyltransferase involved in cell wall biosynthesis
MSTKHYISVIVAIKERPYELRRLLSSIDLQSLIPDELIIVDSSKNSKTLNLINKKINASKYDIKLIKSKPGLTLQRNIGVRKSCGNLLFFFDDDIVLDKNYLQVVNETFTNFAHFNIGGVMGRITNVSDNKGLIYKFEAIFLKTSFFCQIMEKAE